MLNELKGQQSECLYFEDTLSSNIIEQMLSQDTIANKRCRVHHSSQVKIQIQYLKQSIKPYFGARFVTRFFYL